MDLLIFSRQLQGIVGLLALLTFSYYVWILIIKRIKTTNTLKVMNKVAAAVVPEVAGAWPIVGHLPQLVGPQQLYRILGDMADEYGPIFMVRFGMYPTLVVSSWEMVKECFTTNDRFLASRPSSAVGKYLTYDFAMFGFSFYGPYWREIRKISTLELLSHRRLELFKNVPFTEIDTFIKRLYQLWVKNNRNQINQVKDGHPAAAAPVIKVDMSQLLGDLTLSTILKLVVGKNLFNDDDEDDEKDHGEQEEGRKLHETIVEFFKLAGVSVASDALPFLRWLDLDGQKRKMKRIAKEIDLIAERWLQEHQEKKSLSNKLLQAAGGHKVDGHNDFMDVLLFILEDDSQFFNFSRDTVIKATSWAMILGASDTTSVSMTWALTLLLTHPRVLRKAQDELDIKVGRDRHVEELDIENLIYLQAIVKETLRLYPAAPLAIPHEAIQNCTVAGYQVRAGTRVVVNLWKLHRDPRVWSNPSEFRPERFLIDDDEQDGGGGGGVGESTANMNFRGQHFEYIPFGSGRRMCPGLNFALQIVHMTLARLLHAFELRTTTPASLVDMTEGSGLTIPKKTPLEVLLHPRLPLPLYHHE